MNSLDKNFNIVSQLTTSSPLDQFQILDLVSLDLPVLGYLHLSITNSAFYLMIGCLFILVLQFLSTNYDNLISNKWSMGQESLYATIHNIVTNQINAGKGQSYFPFIYALFIFILINNLIGMIPYSFASTSHFILTFALSFTIVIGSTILGFSNFGLKFFSLLVPAGCPLALLPLLVLIELISYLARNISLGLRLAANILSGHMLLYILSNFTYDIMKANILIVPIWAIPLVLITAFSGLEIAIAVIQSQVFVVLASSYIKDGLELH